MRKSRKMLHVFPWFFNHLPFRDPGPWTLDPIIILLLALSMFLMTACREKPKAPPPPPPQVTVAHPLERSVTDYLELTGSTQAVMTVQLRARVSGYLEKVFFQDGQFVSEGQLLFLIQQNTYQDSLRQAESAISLQKAQLEYASAQFIRYSELFKRKAAAQSDVDNWRYQRDAARANLANAEASRDLAKLNLDYTEVRAPFDGRIDRRLVDPGNLVGSGESTILASLNKTNPIYAYFTISDSDLSRLMKEAKWSPGKAESQKWPVFMSVLNEKDYPHHGVVDFASITLTPTTGTLQLRGIFSNIDGGIVPGVYASIRVPVRARMAPLIPQDAVSNDQRGSFVLVVNPSNVVERRGVKTGPLLGQLRVIDEGVTTKEWVVIKGLQKAVPGRSVTPQKQELREPSAASSQNPNLPAAREGR